MLNYLIRRGRFLLLRHGATWLGFLGGWSAATLQSRIISPVPTPNLDAAVVISHSEEIRQVIGTSLGGYPQRTFAKVERISVRRSSIFHKDQKDRNPQRSAWPGCGLSAGSWPSRFARCAAGEKR